MKHIGIALSKNQLMPLTSLRFFAALLVLCQHYFDFWLGHAGVSFFFVLSGFILTYNYKDKFSKSGGFKDFYWRRLARIYPTHLLTLIITLPIFIHGITSGKGVAEYAIELIANIALIQSFFPSPGIYFSLNSVSWSISDEMFFYAVFPFLLSWLGGLRVPARSRAFGFLTMAAVMLIALWVLFWKDSTIIDPTTHWVFYINPFFRLLEFTLGIGIGLNFYDRSSTRFTSFHEFTALIFALISFAAAYLLPPRAGVLLLGIWFVPSALLLVHVFARSDGILSRLLSAKLWILLGESSFMLYMIHEPIIRYATILSKFFKIDNFLLSGFAILISIAGFLLFEKPMQRFVLGSIKMREAGAIAP